MLPQKFSMPVEGATRSDFHPNTFWYYPWGKSVTHKGVDIFAKQATPVLSSTRGIVLYTGTNDSGGNIVIVLGPKWRFHYYAHLHEIKTTMLSIVKVKTVIGSVGATGNAKDKPPHLHYSIVSPIPYIWRIDQDRQGWLKMFYLNPIDFLSI